MGLLGDDMPAMTTPSPESTYIGVGSPELLTYTRAAHM